MQGGMGRLKERFFHGVKGDIGESLSQQADEALRLGWVSEN